MGPVLMVNCFVGRRRRLANVRLQHRLALSAIVQVLVILVVVVMATMVMRVIRRILAAHAELRRCQAGAR